MGKRKDKGEKLFATVFGGDDVKAVFEVVKELAGVAETFRIHDVYDNIEVVDDAAVLAILQDMDTDGLVELVGANVFCAKESPIMRRELRFKPLKPVEVLPRGQNTEAIRLFCLLVLSGGGKPVHWLNTAIKAFPAVDGWERARSAEVRRSASKLGLLELDASVPRGHIGLSAVPISHLFSNLRDIDLGVTPKVDGGEKVENKQGNDKEKEEEKDSDVPLAVRVCSSAFLFLTIVWLLAGQKVGIPVRAVDIKAAWKKFSGAKNFPNSATVPAREHRLVSLECSGTNSRWTALVSPITLVYQRYSGQAKFDHTVAEAAAIMGIELTGESIKMIDGKAGAGDDVTVLTVSTVAFWRMLWLLAGEQVNGVVDRKLACESWKWLSELVDLIADLVDPLVRAGVIEVDNGNIRIMLDPDGDEFSYVVKDGVTPPTFDEIREALVAGALEPKPHSVASAVLEPTGVDMSGLQIDELFELIKAVVGAKDRIEAFLLAKYQQMTFEQLRSVVAELGSFGVNLQMHGKAVHGTASAFDDMLVIKQAHAKIHTQEREVAASLEKLFAPVSEE